MMFSMSVKMWCLSDARYLLEGSFVFKNRGFPEEIQSLRIVVSERCFFTQDKQTFVDFSTVPCRNSAKPSGQLPD